MRKIASLVAGEVSSLTYPFYRTALPETGFPTQFRSSPRRALKQPSVPRISDS